jgi:hypothetical protein
VIIEPGIGLVEADGSLQVSPAETTTYTLTATGPGGLVSDTATVTVTQSEPVLFKANPTGVDLGEPAVLSWSCRSDYADSVSISPGIGAIAPYGSVQVTPDTSTTYTITATGSAGTATQQAVVAINAPVVTLEADPTTVAAGQSAILTWSSTNAVTCSLAPDIGAVDPSGTLSVSPAATTTYTLTATGPGGTTSQSVTVSLPLPQIAFAATPQNIDAGDSATLNWSVTGADTVSIDAAIGAVAAEGSTAVTPDVTTTYTLTATGPGGTATAAVTVSVATPINIVVEAPAAGDVIDRPDTLVRGTFTNSSGAETGISVNDVPALVYGNQFAANHVPLMQGENTLRVLATDSQGHKAVCNVTVHADTASQYCRAIVLPEAGLAPYDGELSIKAPVELSTSDLQVIGPGGVVIGDGPPDLYPLTIEQPGLHRLAVEATDSEARLYTDQVAVLVYDPDQLDALLQAKWNAMKSRLAAGDIDGAVDYFGSATSEDYRAIFTALESLMPQVVQDMQAIEMIYARQGFAKYRIKRSEVIQGQTFSITYNVYFSMDENGVWKIDRF